MDVVKRYQYRKQQEYENFQKQKETQEELISEATDCFFTDNGEETEDQRYKRRN